jgi:two-component system, OmpR family, KDP operon response regulator KdpE
MEKREKAEEKGKILVADDELSILRTLSRNLTRRGYEVITAANGEEALERIEESLPQLIILDLMMPKMGGLEVCRLVREWSQTPIIVLSAVGEERQKVEALDLGADDYLTKPFGMDELLARIRVAFRRASLLKENYIKGETQVYADDDLHIDFARHQVTFQGQEVKLTPKQYDLLKYLTQNAGRVITHRAALVRVWGPEYGQESQYLHVFIGQLRQKIEVDPGHPHYILTEPGVGYRFKNPSSQID